ncbi:hypothetical protein HN51_068648, partial [Arachis hypogaea]
MLCSSRMKSNILGMEGNKEYLLEKIMSVQSRSDSVNTSLFEKREHIEKLHRTCNLLRKVQVQNLVSRSYLSHRHLCPRRCRRFRPAAGLSSLHRCAPIPMVQ